jgi:hypothetical protein
MSTAPPTPGKLFARQFEEAVVFTGSCDATPDKPLYHYTSAEGLKGILSEMRLRATHFAHLNDSGELIAGEKLVDSVARKVHDDPEIGRAQRWLCEVFLTEYEKRTLTNVADVFVASMTEVPNDLSHWRAYGGQGGGYCVGIRLPSFKKLSEKPDADLGVALEKVVYDEADMLARIEAAFRPTLDRFAEFASRVPQDDDDHRDHLVGMAVRMLLIQAGMLVTRYKSHVFQVEQEWRIVAMTARKPTRVTIQFHARPTGLAPYVNVDLFLREGDRLDLASVHVGPTQDPERGVKAAQLLLSDLEYDPKLVVPSGIPLRW